MPYEEVLRQRIGADGFTTSEFRDNRRVIVPPPRLYAVPVGAMAGVPIEVLTEKYTVSYVASGTFLARIIHPSTWNAPADYTTRGVIRAYDANGTLLGTA